MFTDTLSPAGTTLQTRTIPSSLRRRCTLFHGLKPVAISPSPVGTTVFSSGWAECGSRTQLRLWRRFHQRARRPPRWKPVSSASWFDMIQLAYSSFLRQSALSLFRVRDSLAKTRPSPCRHQVLAKMHRLYNIGCLRKLGRAEVICLRARLGEMA